MCVEKDGGWEGGGIRKGINRGSFTFKILNLLVFMGVMLRIVGVSCTITNTYLESIIVALLSGDGRRKMMPNRVA